MRTSERNMTGKGLMAAESRDPTVSTHLSQEAPTTPPLPAGGRPVPAAGAASWLPSCRAAHGPLHLSFPKESDPKFCEMNRTPEKSASLNQFMITYTVKCRASCSGLAAAGQFLLLHYFSFL